MRIRMRRAKKAGMPPGSLVYIGEQTTEAITLSVFEYDEMQFKEEVLKSVDQCEQYKKAEGVTWLNLDGLRDVSLLRRIGEIFSIHPLILEDILNTEQRPKIEDLDNYLFAVLKMYDSNSKNSYLEQVSIIVSANLVITFQERSGDVFEQIRTRIRSDRGGIRKAGADYLAYALIDAVIDNYFLMLDKYNKRTEEVEEKISDNPDKKALEELHSIKKELISIRRSIWPVREMISSLERRETPLIAETTYLYLRDLYDNVIQIIDMIENMRDVVSGLVDLFLSSASYKMNEVMKVLTIIATIFIPLTFIVGIYGMNFSSEASPLNMPELNWRYGYLLVLGVMLVIVVGMVILFKRKKWF